MNAFEEAYARLNAAQKRAVDTIDGPLLVLAGPGTGKTQLLSARVANILKQTDTPANTILCLTFTESGAAAMRERLTRFIGQTAYDVNISTYHAFGGDLIGRYPEYFGAGRLDSPVDDLGKRQILQAIVEAMSYRNPLKQTRHHLGDLMSTLSEVKRALLGSDDLRALAAENLQFIHAGSKAAGHVFEDFNKMPGRLDKARPYFEHMLAALAGLAPSKPASARFEPLSLLCVQQLQHALVSADASGKTTPLTAWKNRWLAKDADNHFIIAGELENRRVSALAGVLDAYQEALHEQGLFDFDDMILRSIRALESHADFRYSLQEHYMYILLDEFQDTNAAQLRLVQLLTDNPVNEGRPNIMAVGDDDQAIYAFQGAQYSNMVEFYEMFRDTAVINLTDNYRSHQDVLDTAAAIAGQIENRLQERFSGMSKQLRAAGAGAGQADIERREFQSEVAERAWLAARVKTLLQSGTRPSEIAVLAPKHKHLEPLVPYLNKHDIPVRYEKRENILDAPVVRQLTVMARLLQALARGQTAAADSLWPQVLSYEFWGIPLPEIWQLAWTMSDERQPGPGWSQAVIHSRHPKLQLAGNVMLAAAARIDSDAYETVLDYLIGLAPIAGPLAGGGEASICSPLSQYYLSSDAQKSSPELFYETLSHLTVLRSRLREFQKRSDSALLIDDFLRFIDMYRAAEQPLLNTSPYAQQADSVQLLTVYKAKGLEYDHVFLVGCSDDVWGGSARGLVNKLTLPANLQPIRHAGETDDERLRILFVALTRARHGLHLTSSCRSYSGKTTPRLKYFNEQQQPDGSFQAMVLPARVRTVTADDLEAPPLELLELDWRKRHLEGLANADLASLLKQRVDNYQLSPTHLMRFTDLEYGGPARLLLDSILGFPPAPSDDAVFGTVIHQTLEWYQNHLGEHNFAPTIDETVAYFSTRLRAQKLTEQRTLIELERGQHALAVYLGQRAGSFSPGDIAEKNFRSEGAALGAVRLTGKVDRLHVDRLNRTIDIVDYKTGKSYSAWKNDLRLHRYKLQLYAYKLLIENSRSFKGYRVPSGRLEFIESDDNGRAHNLELKFEDNELERVTRLMQAVWRHVKALDFPDTDAYPATLTGVKQFEQDLLDGKI